MPKTYQVILAHTEPQPRPLPADENINSNLPRYEGPLCVRRTVPTIPFSGVRCPKAPGYGPATIRPKGQDSYQD